MPLNLYEQHSLDMDLWSGPNRKTFLFISWGAQYTVGYNEESTRSQCRFSTRLTLPHLFI